MEDYDKVETVTDINLKVYICGHCDIKFTSQNDLDLHNQLHAGSSGFSCPLCKLVLPDLQQLQLHDLRHSLAEAQEDNLSEFDIFGQPSASSICLICGEGFNSEEDLLNHCSLHTDINIEANSDYYEKVTDVIEPILIGERDVKVILAKKSFRKPTKNKQTSIYDVDQPFVTEGNRRIILTSKHEAKRVSNSFSEIHPNHLTEENEDIMILTENTKRKRGKGKNTISDNSRCDQCKKIFSNSFSLRRHKSIIHLNKRPYACTVCRKTFIQMSLLSKHTLLHHRPNTETFPCEYCEKKFSEPKLLQQHILTSHGKKYSCEACFKFFSEKEELTLHMKEHVVSFGFDCCRCRRRYKNDWELKRHRCIHEGPRPFLCKVCGKRFNRKYHLTRHTAIHVRDLGYAFTVPPRVKIKRESSALEDKSNAYGGIRDHNSISDLKNGDDNPIEKKKIFQCYICYKKFPDLKRYKQHFMIMHKKVKFNACHICSKQFATAYKVKRHLSCHNIQVKTGDDSDVAEDESNTYQEASKRSQNDGDSTDSGNIIFYPRGKKKSFQCYICHKKNPNFRRFREHFIAEHSEFEFNSCHICSRQFATSYKVKRHLLTHTREKQYKCRICGKKLTQLAHLKRHLKMHSSGIEKRYKCSYCSKKYSDKICFDKHVLMHKTSESSNFKCTVCKEKFPEEKLLDEHILAFHDFFKKFQCGTCKRRFSQGSYLNRHMLIHTGLRKFKCFKCNKRFSTKSDLNRHAITHTDLKPFPCYFCDKCFTRKSNRQKHITLHHDGEDIKVFHDENGIKPFQDVTEQQKLVLMTFN